MERFYTSLGNLRVASCKLLVASCKLRVASCFFASLKLRVDALCELYIES